VRIFAQAKEEPAELIELRIPMRAVFQKTFKRFCIILIVQKDLEVAVLSNEMGCE
jgi:hypothetical protein